MISIRRLKIYRQCVPALTVDQIVACGFILILISLLILLFGSDYDSLGVAGLLSAGGGILVAFGLWSHRLWNRWLLLIAFTGFFVVAYPINALLISLRPDWHHLMLPGDADALCASLFIGILGWVGLSSGYIVAYSLKPSQRMMHPFGEQSRIVLWFLAIFGSCCAAFIHLFFFSDTGAIIFAIWGIIPSVFSALGITAICTLWQKPRDHTRLWVLVLLISNTMLGLLSGQRADVLFPILQFVLFLVIWRRLNGISQRGPALILLAVIVAFGVSFPLLTGFKLGMQTLRAQASGFDRLDAATENFAELRAESVLSDTNIGESLINFSNRLSHLQYGAHLTTYCLEEWGLLYGESILDSIIVFIPRFLWTDKPTIGLGEKAYSMMGYKGPGSATIPISADWYLNFGTLGVFIGMIFIGILYNLVSRHFVISDPFCCAMGIYLIIHLSIAGKGISGAISTILIYGGAGLTIRLLSSKNRAC